MIHRLKPTAVAEMCGPPNLVGTATWNTTPESSSTSTDPPPPQIWYVEPSGVPHLGRPLDLWNRLWGTEWLGIL